jgi:hypothetical protein
VELDAPAQLRDLDAQVVGCGGARVAPDLRDDCAVREQPAGVTREARQQRELRAR